MDNLSDNTKPGIKMKFLALGLILIIVETIIYGAYLFDYFDWAEFVQVAFGVLLICSVMIPIACNAAKRVEKESLECMKNLVRWDGVCTFSINGDGRAAFSGLLFSLLLGALIVWRWEVDCNFVRKTLCATFFGFIAIGCAVLSWCLCHMKFSISFHQDRFIVTRSVGRHVVKQMEFLNNDWYRLGVVQNLDGKGVDALVVEGYEGRRVTILSRISKVAADEICAYATRWIGHSQVEAKQRSQNQVVDFNGGECHD